MRRHAPERARGVGLPVLILVLAGLAAVGCVGDGAGDGGEGAGPASDTLRAEHARGDTSAGVGAPAPRGSDTGEAGALPPDSGPPEAPSLDTLPADTAAADDTAGAGDTAVAPGAPGAARTYFVRLRGGTDPGAVARRHELEPVEVILDPVPALYVSLTPGALEAIRADSSVVSVALSIHEGDTTSPPRIRGVPTSDSSGH